jgi:transcriptional regulator with XRE-family HTH domain
MHGDEPPFVPVYARHRNGPGRRRQMDEYRAAVVAYLKRVRDESGFSLNEIAQSVGVSHTTLTRPVNNPAYKYVPKFATLQRIATLTRINLPAALTTAEREPPSVVGLSQLVVRGMVAAGMWQAAELAQDEPIGTVSVLEDITYQGLPQWAELVRGPSMNNIFEDGDYLHVVGFADTGYHPRPGDEVVVERHRHQDGSVERTCKRIVVHNGALALVGDSKVERWNQPLPYGALEDGDDVRVVGLVIGSYRPRRRA